MKVSVRAKRMARHHNRMSQKTSLNLTSLMDIFTILVFFLMVNSSDVQVLENTKTITMPESVADKKPKDTLVVQVDAEQLIIQGRRLTDVDSVKALKDEIIPELDAELKRQAARRPEMTEQEKQVGRSVVIQGDQKIPYVVLRKIMATAAQAEYRDIALAVSQIPPQEVSE